MKRLAALSLTPALVFALALSTASAVRPSQVYAALVATCDNLESDNVFVARDESVPANGPWVVWATAQIGYKDEALCNTTPIIAPHQSSSSAWVAIEGPWVAGFNPGGSIVQDGYFKCQHSDGCDFSGFPWNVTGYFYAFGNANDLFHLPVPHYIATATSGYHTFKVYLHYLSGGGRQWEFSVDGVIRQTLDDSWRTWTRTTVQTANELWNEGDQLGGTPSSVQNIRAISWYNGTTHTGLTGNPYRAGHCYPWSSWNVISSAWYSTWTTDNHTNC